MILSRKRILQLAKFVKGLEMKAPGWSCCCPSLLSHVQLFAIHGLQHSRLPWPLLSPSRSLLIFMFTESMMPSNHLILCLPLLLLPSIFPSIRVFSNELALCIRWPKNSPSNEYSRHFFLGWTGWISLQSRGLSRVFSSITIQKHQFFGTQPSLWSNSHICT